MGDVEDATTRTIERITVRANVGACTSCGLSEVASQPVPFSGPNPTSIAVVGEAPSKLEDVLGQPFTDEAGDFFRTLLLELRFDISSMAFLYAVSCFADRTPTAREITSCSPNLTAQLELINPSYVLALGGVAVNALRKDSPRLGEIRGMFWHAQTPSQPLVMATWHPSAVQRNNALRQQFEGDLNYFGLIAEQELTKDLLGLYCLKCGSPDVTYVADLPFCDKHKPKEKRK